MNSGMKFTDEIFFNNLEYVYYGSLISGGGTGLTSQSYMKNICLDYLFYVYSRIFWQLKL